MPDKMTQDEIDHLVNNVRRGNIETSAFSPDDDGKEIKHKYHAVCTMLTRLEFARETLSFDAQREARRQLRQAAFSLWLANRKMTRSDYYSLINRELKKRGRPPYFKA